MSRGDGRAKRWKVGIRDLMITTLGIGVSIAFTMCNNPLLWIFGLFVFFGTVNALVEEGFNPGRYWRGFFWGLTAPMGVMALLFLAVLLL